MRSGTTLLRNVLRQHPNLCCPEETQVFRWGYPFGTKEFLRLYTTNHILKKHRQLDGIPESEYLRMLETSTSRGEFLRQYLAAFRRVHKMEHRRVFDKSPQNIYGIPLIKDAFPHAKFICIVRNPLNVVASLREGKVMHIADLVGACAYWNEAMSILHFCKRAIPDDFYVLRYEDFVQGAAVFLREMLAFVGEDDAGFSFFIDTIKPEKNLYLNALSAEEVTRVHEICNRWMAPFGYDSDGAVTDQQSWRNNT